MKINYKKNLLVFLTFNFLFLTAFAQTPNAIKYQTVVRDATGAILNNQNVDFQISILETSASGSAIYVETFSETTNQFGLVNLEIGTGSVAFGVFSSIYWAGDLHFIKIEVDIFDGNGLQDMGTSQLLSVPYALNAKTAENTFSGDYIDLTNQPFIPTQTSDLTNTSGFITNPNDADSDTTNEIQDLHLVGNTLTITKNGSATNIDLSGYANLWQENSNNIYYNGGNVGVGVNHPDGKLIVQADAGMHMDTAIFEVKNKNGKTIFAVYEEGVRVYVDDSGTKSNSNKAGFAVGGFNASKALTNNYFVVSPDSIRAYIESGSSKAGFAVGGFNATKSFTHEFLRVTNDSTRIWTESDDAGFGVKSLNSGVETGYMHITPDNYFIGENSGENLITGVYNSTFGFETGKNLTLGNNNVFLGYQAGIMDTSGGNNNFIGAQSGYFNTDGYYNNFIGHTAGYNNTIGYQNNFMGDRAGYANTIGNQNVFIGDDAGLSNTTGNQNVFIGKAAGNSSLTADKNIFMGMYSGYFNTLGSNNLFLGDYAGYQNDTASNNIFIGSYAGSNNISGHELIIIGNGADAFSNPVNSIAIGYQATVSDTNQVIIGNSFITSIGGYAAWSNLSDKRFKTNVKENVPGLEFILKLKPVTYNLDVRKLNAFIGVKEQSKDEESILRKQNEVQTGFLAQDVEKIAEELNFSFSGVDKPDDITKGHYSLRYSEFVVPLVKAVQEQQEQINELKQELLLQKQINNNLEEQRKEMKLIIERIKKLENK